MIVLPAWFNRDHPCLAASPIASEYSKYYWCFNTLCPNSQSVSQLSPELESSYLTNQPTTSCCLANSTLQRPSFPDNFHLWNQQLPMHHQKPRPWGTSTWSISIVCMCCFFIEFSKGESWSPHCGCQFLQMLVRLNQCNGQAVVGDWWVVFSPSYHYFIDRASSVFPFSIFDIEPSSMALHFNVMGGQLQMWLVSSIFPSLLLFHW